MNVRTAIRAAGRLLIQTAFRTPSRPMAERLAVLAGHRWPGALSQRGALMREIARHHRAPLVAELLCGARMSVPPIPDGVGLYVTGDYQAETSTTRCVARHLSPGDTFLDIGANLGFYTLLAATRVGARGHVHAFEPQPALAACIARSIELNQFHAFVTVTQAAVTDRHGETISLHLPPNEDHIGVASIYPHGWLRNGTTTPVRTVTIDAHLADHPSSGPCVVKLDVEGAELTALRGMPALLSSGRVNLLIVELSPPVRHDDPAAGEANAADPVKITTYLASFGFRPFAIAPSGALATMVTDTALSHLSAVTNIAFVDASDKS